MKYLVLVLLVAVVLGVALPASAQSIEEKGISILFSSGSEKCQWEASMVLKGSISGRHLFPDHGVIKPWRNESIKGQIMFTRDDRGMNVQPTDFSFAAATKSFPKLGEYVDAGHDPEGGYVFEITPDRYKQGIMDTPFVLLVNVKGGEKHFIRCIFKWTYDKDDVYSQKLLWISPIDPPKPVTPTLVPRIKQEERESVSPAKVQEAMAQIKEAFQANLIDHEGYAEAIERLMQQCMSFGARLDRIEAWIARAIAASQANTAPPTPPVVVGPVAETLRQRMARKHPGKCIAVIATEKTTFEGSYKYWMQDRSGNWYEFNKAFSVSIVDEATWSSKAAYVRDGYVKFGVTLASCQTPPPASETYPISLNNVPQIIILGGE